MSSLHQDRLLAEGAESPTGTRSTLAPPRRTSRRPAAEKALSTVPTQRQGKAQRPGTATTTADASASAPRTRRTASSRAATAATARAATTKAAAAAKAAASKPAAKSTAPKSAVAPKAAAKPAAAPTAATKPAAGKARATKAPASKPAATTATTAPAAKAKPAKPAAAKPAAAKSAAAKPAAAKPAAAKATGAKSAGAPATSRNQAARTAAPARPTPYKRPAADRTPDAGVVVDVPVSAAPEVPAVVETVETVETVAPVTGGRFARFRRRPATMRRHPSLYAAAALAAAIGVSAFSTGDPTAAQATDTVSHSVSVAQELGIEAQPTESILAPDTTQHLEELAVSRNARDAEEAAAAQVQLQADEAAAAAAAEAARPKVVLPVNGARLTSTFGPRWGTMHAGIDLAAPMLTPEMAAMDGVVLEAGPASGFGLAVYIQHENGDVTVYGHMDSILVQAGQVVRAGDTIALLGNRGQSTGPHLHFEVHAGGINGTKIDPLPWLRERGINI